MAVGPSVTVSVASAFGSVGLSGGIVSGSMVRSVRLHLPREGKPLVMYKGVHLRTLPTLIHVFPLV